QRAAALANAYHQEPIGLDLGVALLLDLLDPGLAGLLHALHRLHDGAAIVGAQQPLGIGGAERKSRHQEPVAERPDVGHGDEEKDDARDRRVQFLDAVPFVPGRQVARWGIALYLHGRSSSSRMDTAAWSNR